MRNRIARPLLGEEGISLVEVLVGMLILGVAMAALASTSLSALASSRVAQDQVNAAQLLNEVVEHLLARPLSEIAPSGPAGTTAPAYGPTTRRGVPYTISTTVRWVDHPCNGAGIPPESGRPDARTDYLQMEASVSWTVGGTERSLDTMMLRAPTSAERPRARGAGC